jgi:hypothetical protein
LLHEQELVIPLYYRCIVITRGAELSSLNTLISRNREIGKQIRTFHAYGKYYDSEDMHQLLASTPNLHGVSNTCGPSDSFDIQALTTLAQCAGASLTNLSIQIRRPTLPKTTEFIYQFTALKHLDVSSSAVFTYEELTVEKKNAFLNLESVSCAMSNSSFLLLLSILQYVFSLPPHPRPLLDQHYSDQSSENTKGQLSLNGKVRWSGHLPPKTRTQVELSRMRILTWHLRL